MSARKQHTQEAPVAKPDRPRNTQVFAERSKGLDHLPAFATKADSTTMMIAVRIRVAKSEFTPWMPILAKMAVGVAKTANKSAQ